MAYLDLTIPNHAYLFGLLQTDGSIYEGTRNRSKVSIEINVRDKDIIDKIESFIPIKIGKFQRERVTNFGQSSTIGFRICNRAFTDELKNLGIPAGKKSHLIKLPSIPFSIPDYFRGIVDGDGTVGQDIKGRPFIGFITKSLQLADSYTKHISKITGGFFQSGRPNTRDSIYSSTAFCEHAQNFMKYLYYDGCLSLDRKMTKVQDALLWQRPLGMRRDAFKKKGKI